MTSGRTNRERWDMELYYSMTTINVSNVAVFRESVRLQRGEENTVPLRVKMGAFNSMVLVVLTGPILTQNHTFIQHVATTFTSTETCLCSHGK